MFGDTGSFVKIPLATFIFYLYILHSLGASTAQITVPGNYKTITEAVAAAPVNSIQKFYIHIKAGIYNEHVVIGDDKPNIVFVGDGIGKTVITGDKSQAAGFNIYQSPTVDISAKGFIAKFMSFRNTAGPQGYQAVAIRVNSDQAAFYRCSFEGYQDTLLADFGVQFYRECQIYGSVDFIFGAARAVFQNCEIYLRDEMNKVIMAHARTNPDEDTGFSIHNCTIMKSPDFRGKPGKVFLARPWQPYSRVVVMQSDLSDIIDPAGWTVWDSRTRTDLLDFGEYNNRGPGSDTSKRVNWTGVKKDLGQAGADFFTVTGFIQGQTWIPKDIPYTAGLL